MTSLSVAQPGGGRRSALQGSTTASRAWGGLARSPPAAGDACTAPISEDAEAAEGRLRERRRALGHVLLRRARPRRWPARLRPRAPGRGSALGRRFIAGGNSTVLRMWPPIRSVRGRRGNDPLRSVKARLALATPGTRATTRAARQPRRAQLGLEHVAASRARGGGTPGARARGLRRRVDEVVTTGRRAERLEGSPEPSVRRAPRSTSFACARAPLRARAHPGLRVGPDQVLGPAVPAVVDPHDRGAVAHDDGARHAPERAAARRPARTTNSSR